MSSQKSCNPEQYKISWKDPHCCLLTGHVKNWIKRLTLFGVMVSHRMNFLIGSRYFFSLEWESSMLGTPGDLWTATSTLNVFILRPSTRLSRLAANINTQTPNDPVPIAEMVTNICSTSQKRIFYVEEVQDCFPGFQNFVSQHQRPDLV